MVLIEDTRNKPGSHKNIEAYCRQQGIEIVRSKLVVGDYQIANEGGIVVDTKASVAEIAGNVFQDHQRFRAECELAQRCGIQLIVLVEEVLPDGRLDHWRSPAGRDGLPRFKFNPTTLRKVLFTMQDKYGVKIRFCDGRSTGKVLIEYLKGGRK